jgi:hypothetical protein
MKNNLKKVLTETTQIERFPTLLQCTLPGQCVENTPCFICSNCKASAAATITSAGATKIDGDLCLSPGVAITGVPLVSGEVLINDLESKAFNTHADTITLYNSLTPLVGCVNFSGVDLGQVGTLHPGCYTFNTTATLVGKLILSGPGVYIIQIGTALSTGANSEVELIDGAKANQIFWAIGSAVTFGASSLMKGNFNAGTSLTFGAAASIEGTARVRDGAITFDSNNLY